MLASVVDWESRAQTDYAGVATLEDPSIRVVTLTDPGGLGHVAHTVESFDTVVKLIALFIVH